MDSIRLRAQDSAGSDRCHRQQRCEAVKHLADPHVLNFPLAWLLWFVVLAVAMYFARLPAPRVLLSLALALHRALRLMARSALPAEQRLQARNREVLLPAGRDAKERIIEREFERIDAQGPRTCCGCGSCGHDQAPLTTFQRATG